MTKLVTIISELYISSPPFPIWHFHKQAAQNSPIFNDSVPRGNGEHAQYDIFASRPLFEWTV